MKQMTGYFFRMALLLYFCLGSAAAAKELCELQFTDCLQQFNGKTLVVPENVVAVSSLIKACQTVRTQSSSVAPAIVFLIDNSGSMATSDGAGSRFTVPQALIDTLKKYKPRAEVAIIPFTNYLYYNKLDTTYYYSKYFSTLPRTYDSYNQDYLGLMRLDSVYSRPGSLTIKDTGITIVKSAIDTARSGGQTILNYRPRYRPQTLGSNGGATNINIGFIAAKEALAAARAPKEQRFIIFLSDGVEAGTVQAGLSPTAYQKGDSVPTTFTAYFTTQRTAPASISTMTDNIKKNSYSSSNPTSNLWSLETSYTALLNLLTQNVLKPILLSGRPDILTVNYLQSTTYLYSDSAFEFSSVFGLKEQITPFSVSINYQITNESDGASHDTTEVSTFSIQRSVGAALPSGVKTACWEQPALEIWYGGVRVTQIREYMQTFDIRLIPPKGTTLTDPTADVMSLALRDKETAALTDSSRFWTATLSRATLTAAIVGNKTLEHASLDSVIVTYRNPQVPLDTVRYAVPVAILASIPVTAIVRDTNCNGYIDRVDLPYPSQITLRSPLPPVGQVVTQMGMLSADGKPILLTPLSISRVAGDTLRIIMTENTTPVLEAGWNSPAFILSTTPITSDSLPFIISNAIAVDCWQPPVLQAFYAGAPITQLEGIMASFEVRLLSGNNVYSSATIAVSSSLDLDTFSMTRQGSFWTSAVSRTLSAMAINGDQVIQHVSGDSIRIVYTDPRLPQAPVRLVLPFKKPEAVVVNAITRDMDCDGRIDRIDLDYPATLALASPLPTVQALVGQSSLVLLDNSTLTLACSTVTAGAAHALYIFVNETGGVPPQSGWKSALFTLNDVPVTADGRAFQIGSVLDGAGPIVTRATVSPGTAVDTLTVFFSEPIIWPVVSPSNIFSVIDSGVVLPLPPGSATYTGDRVVILLSAASPSVIGDSLMLLPGGLLTDTVLLHNSPGCISRIPIELNPGFKLITRLFACENPFIPGVSLVPQAQRHFPDDQQFGVKIEAGLRLAASDVVSSVVIVDAMGSVVMAKTPMRQFGKTVYFIWNGLNRNGRIVAPGAYIGRVEVEAPIVNKKETQTLMIGVKGEK